MRKVTVSLDDESAKRLTQLAKAYGGNRSRVLRDAVRLLWESEAARRQSESELDTDPALRATLAQVLREAQPGERIDPAEVERRFRGRHRP